MQRAVLLPELPCQAVGPLDALAGGDAARPRGAALTREPELAEGIVAFVQTHGSRANWHHHIHMMVPDGDTAFALRLARYCARNPVALERLTYEPNALVRYRSDKTDGPTVGTETVDPLEFLARVTAHILDKHQVPLREGQRRWAEPLAASLRGGPAHLPARCAGPMRIVAL